MIRERNTCGFVNQRKNLLEEATTRWEKGVEATARFAMHALLIG
jgi:hypothetical protein